MLLGITYTADLPLPWEMSVGLGHLWTLAVEEQFCLLWPLLLAVAFRRKLAGRGVSVAAAICLTLMCWAGLYLAEKPSDVYSSPLTWASAMAIGGVGYYYRDAASRLAKKTTRTAGVLGLVCLVILSLTPNAKESYFTYFAWPGLIAVATMGMIIEVVRWKTVPFRILTPIKWLGQISYGAYLWNMPIVVWTRVIAPDSGHLKYISLLATIPATLIMAVVSWYTLEMIGKQWRKSLDRRTAQSVDYLTVI